MQMIEIKRDLSKVGAGRAAALNLFVWSDIMSDMQTFLRGIVGLAALVLAFTFSLVLFAVIAVGGTLIFAWYWWKTRAIRQEMKSRQGTNQETPDTGGGQIYEGEVIREVDLHIEHRQQTQSEKTDRQEVA
jgi:hypothetical protein